MSVSSCPSVASDHHMHFCQTKLSLAKASALAAAGGSPEEARRSFCCSAAKAPPPAPAATPAPPMASAALHVSFFTYVELSAVKKRKMQT
jgi:hypothetical protein